MHTRGDVLVFRDSCLCMEAEGNHGTSHEPGDTELRRGICFWGTGRGWQLKKNWREVFGERWPNIELPPKPEVPKRPRPLNRSVLEQLLSEFRSYGVDYEELEYWDQRMAGQGKKTGWRVWSQVQYRHLFLGGNTHEAAETLRQLIEKYKVDHNLTGQEPRLGGQPDRSGNEPLINK